MPFFSFDNIAISGISTAVPKIIRRSTDFVSEYGEDAIEKYIKATGINEAYVSSKS